MEPKVTFKADWKFIPSLVQLLPPARKRRINAASTHPITVDTVNDLARSLHPSRLNLVIKEIRDETPAARTIRLVADPESETKGLAFFRAGQYLSLKADVNGVGITRPYSISSSPNEALDPGFYEITIRKKDGGFLTEHIWNNWTAGTRIQSSGPCGFFYYDSLRDTGEIIGLAGGSGITPFRSMLKDIVQNDLDIRFTLLYGISRAHEIIFKDELRELESKAPDRIKVFLVCSEPDECWEGATGFLSAECITRLGGEAAGKTFFICGPQLMYSFLDKELKSLNLPPKRLRREVFGEIVDVTQYPGFPKDMIEKTFDITARIGNTVKVVPGRSTETILVALERAGLAPPSQCRSGECGFCASLLVSGKIFVSPENDGRRMGTKKFGWFHPCSSYPVSNLEINVMRDV